MAEKDRNDDPRRRLDDKGFDPGTGYGGAGSDSAYSRESGYGGQSSSAGSGASIPRGTDEHADESSSGEEGAERDQAGLDRDAPLGGERRDPGR